MATLFGQVKLHHRRLASSAAHLASVQARAVLLRITPSTCCLHSHALPSLLSNRSARSDWLHPVTVLRLHGVTQQCVCLCWRAGSRRVASSIIVQQGHMLALPLVRRAQSRGRLIRVDLHSTHLSHYAAYATPCLVPPCLLAQQPAPFARSPQKSALQTAFGLGATSSASLLLPQLYPFYFKPYVPHCVWQLRVGYAHDFAG